MGLLDKVKFQWWDSKDIIADLIKKWEPKNCKTEKQYEKSLHQFLEQELKDIPIVKQYAKGRIRADIVIKDKVIIELKTDLDTTAKYQRLLGQLHEYDSWSGEVIILLTGTTDNNLKHKIKEYVDEKNSRLIVNTTFFIIEK